MNMGFAFLFDALTATFFAWVSVLTGLCLIGKKLRETLVPAAALSAAFGLIHAASEWFWPSGAILFALIPLLVFAFNKMFGLSYSLASLSVLFASIVFLLHEWLIPPLQYYLAEDTAAGNASYAVLSAAAIYAGFGSLVLFAKPVVFSYRTNMRLFSESGIRAEILQGMVPPFLVLSVMLGWVAYGTGRRTAQPIAEQVILLAFTVAAFVSALYAVKIFSLFIEGKIEGDIDKKHQQEMLNFMQVIRSQRHDFNFHLQAIFGMLENGRYAECQAYVKTMVSEVSDMNEVLPVYHPAVGALLSTFREIASHKGIKLEIFVYYDLRDMPCTVNEINKVIGNLIQNALDELEHDPGEDRRVQVMILKRSGKSVIKVTNKSGRALVEYKNVFDAGYSTKPSHEGIGLNTVQKIAAKYGGTVYPEFEDGNVHFIVQLPNAGRKDSI